MKAAPEQQLSLLELQATDLRLDQLAHRLKTVPEVEQLAALERKAGGLRDLLVGAQTEHSDVDRQRVKADQDVEQVRSRAARDTQRLNSGSGSGKDLENLQSEIASLARRQGELEEVELEILQRLEDIDTRVTQLTAQLAELDAQRTSLAERRDAAVAGLGQETADARAVRDKLAPTFEPPLLALYERVREHSGGTGAAALRQKRCLGCQMEINSSEMGEIRAAVADEVLRHEECGRILIRTPESGI